jgi:hypothetical protein
MVTSWKNSPRVTWWDILIVTGADRLSEPEKERVTLPLLSYRKNEIFNMRNVCMIFFCHSGILPGIEEVFEESGIPRDHIITLRDSARVRES